MGFAVEFYKEFGDLGYLANYSNHGFYKNGVYYKTVEHYYQSEKFSDCNLKKKIISCNTPKEASTIGRDRNNIRVEDFTSLKIDVMREGIYLKFSQNNDIRTKLIETGSRLIREMSVKESFWGVGPTKRGDNFIGKILMDVRSQVRNELLDKIISNCKNRKVYIIGHRNPDCDSFFSAVVLSRILKSYGIDAVCAVRDKKYVDYDLINDFLDEDVCEVNDFSDKYFILVDHNNLDGIPKENILGAIDHHKISGEVSDLIEIEYSSCGLLIYDLFKDRYHFTNDDKLLISLTVLSDTEFLTSRRVTSYDRLLFDEIGSGLDIEYLRNKYLVLNINLDNINYNLLLDYKKYDYLKNTINRSLIKSSIALKNKYYDKYVATMDCAGIDLLIWCCFDNKTTYVCYKGEIFKFIYFTSSTYLILDYLNKKGYLS